MKRRRPSAVKPKPRFLEGGALGARVQGFSLLEVLVALTIMGITVAVLFYGFSQSARLRTQAQEVLEASRVARTILTDSALMAEAVRRGVLQGPVSDEPGWFYRLEAHPLVVPLERDTEAYEDPNMVELTLCVYGESQRSRASRCVVSWYERKG
ncbi:pilus assembly FimT family protein [Desulfosoma caldarium]|nr:type II secretion system protein [Desulfosoma caldarium]